jgi:hypothetical protein
LRTCRCHGRRSRSFWLWWWRNNHCRRICRWRMGRRRNNHRGRSCWLFNLRRRRNYHSRRSRCWLCYRGCNHNTSFRWRSSRFGRHNHSNWLFRRWRRRRSWRCYRRRGRNRFGHNSRRFRCRRRLLCFLLPLPQQLHYIARLGNLREVNFWFDFRSGRPIARRRTGLGGKIFPYPFRFILLN